MLAFLDPVTGGDADATAAAILQLHSPYLHYEAVRAALKITIERTWGKCVSNDEVMTDQGQVDSQATTELVSHLLASLCANGILSPDAVQRGFKEAPRLCLQKQ